jgi:hypothetical protein
VFYSFTQNLSKLFIFPKLLEYKCLNLRFCGGILLYLYVSSIHRHYQVLLYTFLIGFAGFGLAYFLFFILLGKNVFGIHNQFIQRI